MTGFFGNKSTPLIQTWAGAASTVWAARATEAMAKKVLENILLVRSLNVNIR